MRCNRLCLFLLRRAASFYCFLVSISKPSISPHRCVSPSVDSRYSPKGFIVSLRVLRALGLLGFFGFSLHLIFLFLSSYQHSIPIYASYSYRCILRFLCFFWCIDALLWCIALGLCFGLWSNLNYLVIDLPW
jgi:hypothetical protein